jgi:hypothetical protein
MDVPLSEITEAVGNWMIESAGMALFASQHIAPMLVVQHFIPILVVLALLLAVWYPCLDSFSACSKLSCALFRMSGVRGKSTLAQRQIQAAYLRASIRVRWSGASGWLSRVPGYSVGRT